MVERGETGLFCLSLAFALAFAESQGDWPPMGGLYLFVCLSWEGLSMASIKR